MDERKGEILAKLFARAKPPPILYRYRKPNDWTLSEISKHEIFAAAPDDLNDPFECSAPVDFDLASLRQYFIEAFAPIDGLLRQGAQEIVCVRVYQIVLNLS